MEVGQRIRSLRAERGMSAKELADAAHLSAKALSEIENGKVEPRADSLQRLASALGVGPDVMKPPARGEDVLLMLYRSLPPEKQKRFVQQLAAMAAGMDEEVPSVPDDDLDVARV